MLRRNVLPVLVAVAAMVAIPLTAQAAQPAAADGLSYVGTYVSDAACADQGNAGIWYAQWSSYQCQQDGSQYDLWVRY